MNIILLLTIRVYENREYTYTCDLTMRGGWELAKKIGPSTNKHGVLINESNRTKHSVNQS